MRVNIECFPLKSPWPKAETPAHRRRHSPFRVSYDALWYDVERELEHASARAPWCEFDMDRTQFRKLDTRPFANASRRTPKVMLSFEKGDLGRLYFPCDRYLTWEGNLRAISLTLEALRRIDRYGATAGEQYRGFRRLTAGGGATFAPPTGGIVFDIEAWERTLTPMVAADFLAGLNPEVAPELRSSLAQLTLMSDGVRRSVIANALKATHPDQGGDRIAFEKVQAARRVLDGKVETGV